jgi:DNA-binding CsgD family transcriptional regulator
MTVFVETTEPLWLMRRRLQFRYGLSSREAELMVLLAGNLRRGEISAQLGISPNTVKTHLRQISMKLSDQGISLESILSSARRYTPHLGSAT